MFEAQLLAPEQSGELASANRGTQNRTIDKNNRYCLICSSRGNWNGTLLQSPTGATPFKQILCYESTMSTETKNARGNFRFGVICRHGRHHGHVSLTPDSGHRARRFRSPDI